MTAPRRILTQDRKAHEEIHALLLSAFAYMDGKIDPPSSLYRLTLHDIADTCSAGEVWAIGEPIFACIFLTPRAHALYLGKLAVAEIARGQGHARALIQLAEQRARLRGLNLLELQTRIELTQNQATFRALGFSEIRRGSHPGYERITEVTLQKQLNQ